MPAASTVGICSRTAHKWLKRFLECGMQGLQDHSSRPERTRTNLHALLHERIDHSRRSRPPMRRIASLESGAACPPSVVCSRAWGCLP